ncbi:porin [Orenia marismortui]|uniref:Porin-like protein n=1 Tax=Orenia marismortui TaxID=46469 RepID=A0A4R8HLI7_9FIRM|nr:porin [Orenia marismortui]TDX59224.1 porin-like protein [Orenia marismortui]
MKKISVLLTFVLVLALAVPAFAAEDNVKITGEVKTIFEAGTYGDDDEAAVTLWADDDVLDLDNPFAGDGEGDMDDYYAEKAFYQEIDFAVAGMVNENITFDLAIDTLVNNFTNVESATYGDKLFGDQGEDEDLKMDTALLTISDGVSTLKLGDVDDYANDVYFIDEEDMEMMELSTKVSENDLKVFVAGSEDFEDQDFYGVTLGRDLGATTLTGKLYQSRYEGYAVSNFAVAADVEVSDMVTINGEVVANSADKEFAGDADRIKNNAEGDTAFFLGADVAVSDALTLNAKLESVGEEFVSVAGDLEEDYDYDLFTVGADYALNDANTVGAAYTLVDHNEAEDKSTIELSLDNVTGAFTNTAAVAFTTNDGYAEDTDVTVITLGTEYAMSKLTTISAKLVNQSADDYYDNEFTYLAAGLDHQISETVSWDTEARFITGEDKDEYDGEGSSLRTQLNVKF